MSLIVYTKQGCPWCEEVLELLRSKSITFDERECRNNEEHFAELKKKSGQDKTPTLDVDGDILADSDAQAVSVFLKKKGFPQFQ